MIENIKTPNCDSCPKRGQCCKNFNLHSGEDQPPWSYSSKDSKKRVINRLKKENLPFVPIKIKKYRWLFKCSQISKDGKCKIYSSRPQLCRDFHIGENPLCYYYGKEKL